MPALRASGVAPARIGGPDDDGDDHIAISNTVVSWFEMIPDFVLVGRNFQAEVQSIMALETRQDTKDSGGLVSEILKARVIERGHGDECLFALTNETSVAVIVPTADVGAPTFMPDAG
jgi:hypothetical protein